MRFVRELMRFAQELSGVMRFVQELTGVMRFVQELSGVNGHYLVPDSA